MFPRTEERRGTSSVAFRQGGRKDPRGATCDVRCADSPMGSEIRLVKIKSRPKTRVSEDSVSVYCFVMASWAGHIDLTDNQL